MIQAVGGPAYGGPNLGDEAIVQTMIAQLREDLNLGEVEVVTVREKSARAGVQHELVRQGASLRKELHPAKAA